MYITVYGSSYMYITVYGSSYIYVHLMTQLAMYRPVYKPDELSIGPSDSEGPIWGGGVRGLIKGLIHKPTVL